MPTQIEQRSPRRAHRWQRFDWAPYFNGRIWRFEQGVDFTHKPHSFREAVYRAADRYGVLVHVQAGATWVELQATDWVTFDAQQLRDPALPGAKQGRRK